MTSPQETSWERGNTLYPPPFFFRGNMMRLWNMDYNLRTICIQTQWQHSSVMLLCEGEFAIAGNSTVDYVCFMLLHDIIIPVYTWFHTGRETQVCPPHHPWLISVSEQSLQPRDCMWQCKLSGIALTAKEKEYYWCTFCLSRLATNGMFGERKKSTEKSRVQLGFEPSDHWPDAHTTRPPDYVEEWKTVYF